MGNVYASSQKNSKDSGFPPMDTHVPISTLPPMPTDTACPPESKLDNPGTMEELHKKCKDLFPLNFEGAKIGVQKVLSNHFQISHAINMSSVTPSGYRFGATYVGTHQFGPTESYPVLIGDIDPAGNLNANMYYKLNEQIMLKFQGQFQNDKLGVAHFSTDYKGKSYTASCTIANPDIVCNAGVMVGHYLQSVTENLALGAEIAYQRSPQIPGGQIAVVSMAGRYTTPDFSVSGTLGASGVHVCYYQKASDQLQLGVEFETNFRMQESVASVGYQIDLPKADLVFKGMVDSNWNVGATIDKKLMPMPFSLTLSGMLNHQKNQFRLGIGFMIG